MAGKRLIWKLYPSYLVIILIAVVGILWLASDAFHAFHLEEAARNLQAHCRSVESQVADGLADPGSTALREITRDLAERTESRITLIRPDGVVVADSAANPDEMDNHGNRPEVKKALKGVTGESDRYSHTLGQHMVYVAIPVIQNKEVVGVVRVSLARRTVDRALHDIYIKLIIGGLLVAAMAGFICYLVSRHISRPLEEMEEGAKRFAAGQLDRRLPVYDSEELGELAQAMNEMAAELGERIHTIVRQKGEQDTVLSSMVEGVLAVDKEERLITINRAAAEMLGIRPEEARGKFLQEAVRNADLQRLMVTAQRQGGRIDREIVLRDHGQRFLQANGTALRDSEGKEIGALVVLSDVTRLRKLERMRRDFVANVSHEWKTPLTSIKGFVETLANGALNDPEYAQRFLAIIAKHTDRLNAIIDDLLTLSQLEQDSESEDVQHPECALRPILTSAIDLCRQRAAKKDIRIASTCPADLKLHVNAALIEQALVNLMDNAVKYSDNDSEIHVRAEQAEDEVKISVKDHGCGIAPEHHDRLFERFYRVDRARSRRLGGTGLGLAIVKHIAQAHRGHVTVESEPGQGTTFSIYLPAIKPS